MTPTNRPTITQTEALDYLERREPFEASHLSAIRGAVTDTAYPPDEWAERYAEDEVTYTVLSYRTPIAWVTEDGEIVQPPVRYSVTTTNHQRIANGGLHGKDWPSYLETERRAVPVDTFGPRSGWW